MKKILLTIILGTLLITSMCLTGCGDEKTEILYDYNLDEYITVGQYKGIEVDAIKVEVTADDIDAEIENRLNAAAIENEVLEGTVEKGDKINIDYVGTIDGVAFDGGSTMGNGTTITVGLAGYIDGFEDGLVGMEVGKTKVLDLKFPDNYHNTDLAGKDCQFEVTINSKLESSVPSYDLEFVKANSECNSLNEYEQNVYEELMASATETAEITQQGTVWSQIVEASTVIKYPEKEFNEAKEVQEKYVESFIKQYGMTMEQYLETVDKTQEEFDEELNTYVEGVIKNEMVLYQIVRLEGLELTSEEYEDGKAEILQQQGFESEDAFKQAYGQSFEDAVSKESIEMTLLLEKVIDMIMENAEIKES